MEIIQHDFFCGKSCSKCGIWQGLEDYDKNPKTRDGRITICKSCRRKYAASIAEIARERTRQWITVNGRPPLEQRREQARRWRKKNPEKVRLNRQKYHKLHPEISATTSRRYLARKVGCEGSHKVTEWRQLCEQFGFKCLRCGKKGKLAADHIVPISKGGTDYIDNIQPLCHSCNSWKKDRTIDFRPQTVIEYR